MSRNTRMHGRYEHALRTANGVTEQRCVFCGEWKAMNLFPKNGTDKHGNVCFRQDCKDCYNIRRRENKTKKKHSDFLGGQRRRGEDNPDLSFQEWKECVIFFGGACAYCGCTPKKGTRLTRDHLEPVSRGGKTVQSNIVPACHSCNSSKGADDFKEWYMKQTFFSQEKLNKIFQWRTMLRQLE